MPDLDPVFVQAIRERAAASTLGSSAEVWSEAVTRGRRNRHVVGVATTALVAVGSTPRDRRHRWTSKQSPRVDGTITGLDKHAVAYQRD